MLDFKNIARTARSIVHTETGFAEPCRIPDNPSEAAITRHADALLLILEDQADDSAATKTAKAAPRAKFVAYEMPADFVRDLRADREAIREANKHNQGETQEGVENTEPTGQILGRAANDVQELDAIMTNKYARQPETLAPHSGRRNQRRAAPHPRPSEIPDSEG